MTASPTSPQGLDEAQGVILFDGVCNLCNGTVNFVIDRDPDGHFKFAALQSTAAQALLKKHRLDPKYLDSVLLIEKGRCYRDSSAALRIARRMRGIWSVLFIFIIVPRFLRDFVYHFIAKRRYRWFGQSDACRIPTPELRARFLDDPISA